MHQFDYSYNYFGSISLAFVMYVRPGEKFSQVYVYIDIDCLLFVSLLFSIE